MDDYRLLAGRCTQSASDEHGHPADRRASALNHVLISAVAVEDVVVLALLARQVSKKRRAGRR